MQKHVILVIAIFIGLSASVHAQYGYGYDPRIYQEPRDRNDYLPTYEIAARRKALGLPLNNRELRVYKDGPPAPAPGSIDAELEKRERNARLRDRTQSQIEKMKASHGLAKSETHDKMQTQIEYEKQHHALKRQFSKEKTADHGSNRGKIVFEFLTSPTKSRTTSITSMKPR